MDSSGKGLRIEQTPPHSQTHVNPLLPLQKGTKPSLHIQQKKNKKKKQKDKKCQLKGYNKMLEVHSNALLEDWLVKSSFDAQLHFS